MFDKLDALERRLEMINGQLMDPEVTSNSVRLREISQEHRQLDVIVSAWLSHKALMAELEDAKEMLSETDAELREMAKAEVSVLQPKIEQGTKDLQLMLLPKDPNEGRPLLLEIRAGTGGDEAALFAADLFRMYCRFSERNGLKIEMLSSSLISVGGTGKTHQGFKEVIAAIRGAKAYNLFQFESGVHRVQRVPQTESQGRIHTSAATVAVLPEPDAIEVKLPAKDLRIDTMRAGGPGGQSVNTTDSAVRIVHIPTGLIVQCQDEKSQLKNKAKAMRVPKARLLERQRSEQHEKEAANRKAQVGTGDRSERIRTYNFPQNRCTDHRIGLTLYKLDALIEGDLTEMVETLLREHQAEMLASLEEL